MASFSIWNRIQPQLKLEIQDKHNAEKVEDMMKPYMLSDGKIYALQEILKKEMHKGLDKSSGDSKRLPMKITFVTDRYKQLEIGDFISICAHAHSFTITLVRLKSNDVPKIHKKDYFIDANTFKKPYIKIYEAFANCVKDFFIEYNLDGKLIPASFCTNLYMKSYSLDTAVIPHFVPDSSMHPDQMDIKASFEQVLQNDNFQGDANLIKTSLSSTIGNIPDVSDTERIFHAFYDAKMLGSENVLGLEITLDNTHNLLDKFQKHMLEIGEPIQKILLDISHAGVKVCDKVFKNALYHHPIHKISHIVQDFTNCHIFGYLCGDFLKGHQFFGFKTDKNSTEVVSLMRNIIEIELIRKKKEKLEMQASQVFITLKCFLSLARELKVKEKQIPLLLKQRICLVEDINWWIEGCWKEVTVTQEKHKEIFFHVQLQELYATAHWLKQREIERELTAKLEREKLSGKRRRRKKKAEESEDLVEPSEDKAASDIIFVKALNITIENLKYFEDCLQSRRQELAMIHDKLKIVEDALKTDSDFENLNPIRDFCVSILNIREQEGNTLNEKLSAMISLESVEREKIQCQVPEPYIGKKQHLVVTKKLVKDSIFEDICFEAPKRLGKAKSELLNSIFVCEEYFTMALKMRKEEVEELNYYISTLHFRETITKPEDSRAIDSCRRLLVIAIKMRLKEIQDIEWRLKELKEAKEKTLYMVPDTIQYIATMFQFASEKRRLSMKAVETLLSDFRVDLVITTDTINFYSNILSELKSLTEKDIVDVEKEVSEIQNKQRYLKSMTHICYEFYDQAIKKRKKEFNVAVSDMDLFETIVATVHIDEEVDIVQQCQEIYLTCASMREIEIETLELEMKSSYKDPKIQESLVVTLKDLFHAAVELEKNECQKILDSVNREDDLSLNDIKILPVVYNFKDLFEVVSQYLKENKNELKVHPSSKNHPIYTSLKDFFTVCFELKQKEIEIPVQVLRKSLENVLIGLIEEVKKRKKEKQLQCQIHEQALKISRSWKEVFLIAIDERNKEMKNVISTKKKEINEEAAILQLLKDNDDQSMENETNQFLKSWERIFSFVIEMKTSEVEKVNQLLKNRVDRAVKNNPSAESRVPSNIPEEEKEGYSDVNDVDAEKRTEEKPSEEILQAIETCKHIYAIAIAKSSSELEEMEYEMRPIFSVEYDEEKVDLAGDEISKATDSTCKIILDWIEFLKTEVSSMKNKLESLTRVEENIKSQTSSAKATSAHFLADLLELEENAVKDIEKRLQELQNAFGNLKSQSGQVFRPFTDLLVDVMSDEVIVTSAGIEQELVEKENLDSEQEVSTHKLSKDEIQSLLLEVESELKTGDEEAEEARIKEGMDIFFSFKKHLELTMYARKNSVNSICGELEKLKLPDPKKIKPKEKIARALQCIVRCKGFYASGVQLRHMEVKGALLDVERVKGAQNKEEHVAEYESSEIAGSCRSLFLSAAEYRSKNISMMKLEVERLETVQDNLIDDTKPEVRTLVKSQIYTTCKDLVLESVDMKMKEIDDIASQLESLNNIELKVGIQLKQLDPEKHKAVCTKLEKTKDAVVTCKKVCTSAVERAKKEVRDTDEELGLLKGALESSETSLVTATCKQLLLSATEKRKSEILEMQHEVSELRETVEELTKQLLGSVLPKTAEDDEMNLFQGEILRDLQSENYSESLKLQEKEMEPESKDTEIKSKSSQKELQVISSKQNVIDIEEICKLKIVMVSEFLKDCRQNLLTNILRRREEISFLEADLDKIKVTLQKVEGEDSQVFTICQNIFLPTVEMRREEIKSFEVELKVLQKLGAEYKSQTAQTSQKTDVNQEESEVALAVASSKRVLNLAMKNRRTEKDAIEFELMKLVRFQDSRIANMCKQFLLTTMQNACQEMGNIKIKFLKVDGVPTENEHEMLAIAVEVLLALCLATLKQIEKNISDMQLLAKRKLQMEIEESQFVMACRNQFSSQIRVREKEITVMMQELDTLSESQTFKEGFDVKVMNVQSVYEKMISVSICTRKKETESFQFQLIKHYDIKVSEQISAFEKNLLVYVEDVKNEIKVCGTQNENFENVRNSSTDELWTELCRLQKFFSACLAKRNKDCRTFEDILTILQGKNKLTDKERKFDIWAPIKADCSEKLKTEASVVIGSCKEILYSIIEVAETEIREINVVKYELKRPEEVEGVKQKKKLSLILDKTKFTEREIALLEALEQDILESESAKNQEVTEFCEQFFSRAIVLREELVLSTKTFLETLSIIEENLTLKASKLVYCSMNAVKSFLDQRKDERNRIKSELQNLEEIKALLKDENHEIIDKCQEILKAASVIKSENVAITMISIETLKQKEEENKMELVGKKVKAFFPKLPPDFNIRNEIFHVYRECCDLLLKVLEMMEWDAKLVHDDLENLSIFGFDDVEDESKLSEDENAIQKCRLFLLATIGTRRKLEHNISLEMKFLKGSYQAIRTENSSVFPSWCERFSAFLNFENKSSKIASFMSPVLCGASSKKQGKCSDTDESSKAVLSVLKIENFKDILKSLEQHKKKQPIYVISTWDDLLLRSFLLDQIEINNNLEQELTHDKNWEDLLFDAHTLFQKQINLSKQLKEKKQLFLFISTWSEVFFQAIIEWNTIVKEEEVQLRNENLLLRWTGQMQSKENVEYSSGCRYGFQTAKFDKYLNSCKNATVGNSEETTIFDDTQNAEWNAGSVSSSEMKMSRTSLDTEFSVTPSPWNDIFSQSVMLMVEGQKTFNLMRQKDTKLQSEVIKELSSWDTLFLKAIEKTKADLQEERKENDTLKNLAKSVNEEMQGHIKRQMAQSQMILGDSWVDPIFESSLNHISNLFEAVMVKRRDMEKLSSSESKNVNSTSEYHSLLDLTPETLLLKGEKMLVKALAIRKDEMRQMEKELKLIQEQSESIRKNISEIPPSILIWKLIVSIAVSFKSSGLIFEPPPKKHLSIIPKELFSAALRSKQKEIDCYESYWKKFTEKRFFLNVIPTDMSWSKTLHSISELAMKDLAKMSMFGLKYVAAQEDIPENSEDNDRRKILEDLEDSVPWTDLILEAVIRTCSEDRSGNVDCSTGFESCINIKELPISWDEIFFCMNRMNKGTIQDRIFINKSNMTDISVEDIKKMVSSNFSSWDTLLIAVIEEILWAVQGMTVDKHDINDVADLDRNVSSDSKSKMNCQNGDQQKSVLRSILKKLDLSSFTDLLPSHIGFKKIEAEDNLSEAKKKMLIFTGGVQENELNEECLWKHLFPVAIKVWRKKMEDYLNFQESETFNQKDSMLKQLVEMNEQQNEIQLPNSSTMLHNMRGKFKNGENMNPEYFDVTATWSEVYGAALERHKKILFSIMNLQEMEDSLQAHTNHFDDPKSAPSERLKFQASNVLLQEITLQDLFEIVDCLRKRNLVNSREIERIDELVHDAPPTTIENLEVSEVIISFRNIFAKAFITRKSERDWMEHEIEKLTVVTSTTWETFRVLPVVDTLLEYFEKAVKCRKEENSFIESKLRSLNEFRNLFSGYIDCPVSESLPQRNVRRMDEIKNLHDNFNTLQNTVKQKLQQLYDSLMSAIETHKERRKDEKINDRHFYCVNELGMNLNNEDQEIFKDSRTLFSSVKDLRENEISELEMLLPEWKKLASAYASLENTVHAILLKILKFHNDGMLERKKVINLMLLEMENLSDRKSRFKLHVSMALTNCKSFLLTAVDNRKNEVDLIKSALSIKTGLIKPKAKTLDILSLCEAYCYAFIEKRELEIQNLEGQIHCLDASKVPQIQSASLELFSNAIASRKDELKVIEDYLDSLNVFDEEVESELSEAIEEALADVVDLSDGRTFFRALSSKKENEKDKADPKVFKACSEFFAERIEKINSEIEAMEGNCEMLRSFKGNVILEVIAAIGDFEDVLNKEIHTLQYNLDSILSEMNLIQSYQDCLQSEIIEYVGFCKEQCEENINEIKHDMHILRLQLNILSEDDAPEDISTSFSFDMLDATEEIHVSSPKEKIHNVEAVHSKKSSLIISCLGILNSALEFRMDSIALFTNEVKSLDGAENKAFQILSSCKDYILNVCEKRNLEKQRVEDVIVAIKKSRNSDILATCTECMSGLLQFNVDCLRTSMPDFDRLKMTVFTLEQKRSAIFIFCEQVLQSTIDVNTNEVKNMNSELTYMEFMRTSEDSEYITSCKEMFQKGIEHRKIEMRVFKNDIEALEDGKEILPVVILCRQHLINSIQERKLEISLVNNQIEVLKNEAAMLLLMYAPALETIVEGNKKILQRLMPAVQKLNAVIKELETESTKILQACQKFYCTMLESLKIEREAIKYDIDSLREAELEEKDIIDTEGKELVVSFKDLFLSAFNLKKSDLEKEIRKRNIRENVKMKRQQIVESVSSGANEEESTSKVKERGSKEEYLAASGTCHESGPHGNEKPFSMYVTYYETKKELRKSSIEKQIMNEFDALENMLMIKSGEKDSLEISKLSEEDVEASLIPAKDEPFFNRVYEVKLKEIEEEIKFKQEKIKGVIQYRKSLMEDVIKKKKTEMEKNIARKEEEMKKIIDSIRGKESQVVCTLKDLYDDILQLKVSNDVYCSFLKSIDKNIMNKFRTCRVSVKLENFMEIVLAVKEEERQMLLQSKYKDLEKMIFSMKKESERLIAISFEKLNEAIEQFRRSEKSKAMEYAVSGGSTSQKDSYAICEDEIFPNVNLFKQYVDSFKDFFSPVPKRAPVLEDTTFRSEELLKNSVTHIPLFKNLPFENFIPNHVLKLLEVEINSLKQILSEMNLDKARAILLGLSFLTAESATLDASSKISQKEILLDIVAALNENTSLLMLGSFIDHNCDISLNLDKDCSLAYFEKIENVRKWSPPLDIVKEVAIDIGLKHFNASCLDGISTKFDCAVNTSPMGSSRFERFIGDIGLLEQIKVVFLEMHHHHLLCRRCNFNDSFKDLGLSFDNLLKLLGSKSMSQPLGCLPVSGSPSSDDLAVAQFVVKNILGRGALLTAICLTCVLERLGKKRVSLLASSFFIQECTEYREFLKTFVSALSPKAKVEFIFCKKSSCGIGAAVMASVANHISRETPELYLLELQQRLIESSSHFSIQNFLKLLSNPRISCEAIQLAQRYLEEMKFDLPLAVVWAYLFINGKMDEAENLYKVHPVSLSKVNHLICREINSNKNFELARTYVQFLKSVEAEQHVKINAYRTLFDVLFCKDMYQDAIALILECLEYKIPLSKLRHSTLTVLHDFCERERKRKGGLPYFHLPAKPELFFPEPLNVEESGQPLSVGSCFAIGPIVITCFTGSILGQKSFASLIHLCAFKADLDSSYDSDMD